jgi:ribokinase
VASYAVGGPRLKVLVVGNAVLDIAYEVEALPTAGQTLLARGRRASPGGKGLNQAVLARRAGADVDFCAVVGDDAAGATIRACLQAERLSADGLISWSGPTDESVVVVADSGENLIVSTAQAARSLSVSIAERAVAGLGRGDLLLLQGNLTAKVTRFCLEKARRRGAGTILNPAPVAFDCAGLWPLVDIGIANEVEIRTLGGDLDEEAAAKALCAQGAGCIIVTLGARGAFCMRARVPTYVAASSVEVLDTSGAGDVLCGVLAAALTLGLDTADALRWAVAAASLSVTRKGTFASFPTSAELERLRRATSPRRSA